MADTYNFSIFGLKLLDENGKVRNTEDQGGHTYFRNMVLEFIFRHYPRVIFDYFPNMSDTWQWGKCRDLAGFRKFITSNFDLIDDPSEGAVSIITKETIKDVVFHPNKFKRAQIRKFAADEE